MTLARPSWTIGTLLPACFCGVRHGIGPSEQRLEAVKTTLALLIVLCLSQWTIGHWSGSLVVQADAGHLVADILALVITGWAIWLGKQPATGRATFGHQRLEILAALFNGLSLVGISGWIIYESVMRWQSPPEVLSLPMLLGSLLGLLVNGFNLSILSQGSQQNLNLRAAFLHTAADFASSIGAMVAGISIHLWHCFWIDACIGLMVAGLTIVSAFPLIQESLEVMLEYAPKSIDVPQVRQFLTTFPEIEQVTTLRVWSLTPENVVLCLHLQVGSTLDFDDRDRWLDQLQNQLKAAFAIQETIIQISSLPQRDLHPLFHQSLLQQVTRNA
jgi:cobalt-zinc-cadmium efflux system protein